ncbi:hypothetical protein SCLCIDRAFT_1020334 [Scleroderma citrinum Foug A]|uniref:Uncharacterized protein n=1 Tax=Scleroderma citrinum Foug A TaxID=1036808 RepID=A0A0C3DTX0_9AGAM|nr:hypothetical protein SCLCIDRAFT_1020334 [Scleroderma citrinum Foug A]
MGDKMSCSLIYYTCSPSRMHCVKSRFSGIPLNGGWQPRIHDQMTLASRYKATLCECLLRANTTMSVPCNPSPGTYNIFASDGSGVNTCP